MTNRRKIAAKRVFVVFGNDDVQTGFQRFCVIACGSECRRFESVRAPSKKKTSPKGNVFFCEKSEGQTEDIAERQKKTSPKGKRRHRRKAMSFFVRSHKKASRHSDWNDGSFFT